MSVKGNREELFGMRSEEVHWGGIWEG